MSKCVTFYLKSVLHFGPLTGPQPQQLKFRLNKFFKIRLKLWPARNPHFENFPSVEFRSEFRVDTKTKSSQHRSRFCIWNFFDKIYDLEILSFSAVSVLPSSSNSQQRYLPHFPKVSSPAHFNADCLLVGCFYCSVVSHSMNMFIDYC